MSQHKFPVVLWDTEKEKKYPVLIFPTFCLPVLKCHLFLRHHFIALKNTFSNLRSLISQVEIYSQRVFSIHSLQILRSKQVTEVSAGYEITMLLKNYQASTTVIKLHGMKLIFAESTGRKFKMKLCRTDYIKSNKNH